MDTTDLEQIHKKLADGWADWTDDDQCYPMQERANGATAGNNRLLLFAYDIKNENRRKILPPKCRILRETRTRGLNQFAKQSST